MSHTPDFQQNLTPHSFTFHEVADNFPLVQGDPGPVNFASGAWLPELPPTPDTSALVGTPLTPGPLYFPTRCLSPMVATTPFNFDDITTGNTNIPPYEYYGLDVDIPASASTSTTSAQPLTTTIANSQSVIEVRHPLSFYLHGQTADTRQIVEDTTKKPSKAAKGKAKGKARGAAAGAGDGDEGRLLAHALSFASKPLGFSAGPCTEIRGFLR
uniref:Uncharacterized protein n=1 Tax=Mycena chlorophos TaxID=658473 RepID=A0ABQ0KY99_MYCCL|nr:predicted protein [Mycena chlorophos]